MEPKADNPGPARAEAESTPSPSRTEADVAAVLAEFEAGLDGLRRLYAQRQELMAALSAREVELRGLEAGQAQRRREAEAEAQSLAEQRAALGAARAEAARADELAAERLAAAVAREAAINAEHERRAGDLDAARSALERVRADLEQRASEEAGRAREATARAADLERQIADLRASAEASRSQAASESAAVAQRLARAEEMRDELAREVVSLRTRHAELERQAAQAAGVAPEGADVLMGELKGALAAAIAEAQERRGVADELKAQLRGLIEARREQQERGGVLEAELERCRHELARHRAGAPRPAVPGVPEGRSGAAIALRRARLRRHRELLREQRAKVAKAAEAIRQRFDRQEEAEQVLTQRNELVSAKRALDEAQKRVRKMWATSRTSTLVFYALASLAVLGALSWIVTGHAAPGRFAATAVVQADMRGRTLSDAELGEWRVFHEKLLQDPTFHEVVAQRLGRRGMTDLAEPGRVAAILAADLDHTSPLPDQIAIELRGTGGPRTARVLETLVTALASQANASRERRVDGAGTLIITPATAALSPLDNTRLVTSAAVAAGGLLFSLVLGLLVWRRLADAKIRFDRETQVDAVLDDSRWPDPRRRPTGV